MNTPRLRPSRFQATAIGGLTAFCLAFALLITSASCSPEKPLPRPQPEPETLENDVGPGRLNPEADRPDWNGDSGNGTSPVGSGASDPIQPKVEPSPGPTDPIVEVVTPPPAEPETIVVPAEPVTIMVPMSELPEVDSEAWKLLVENTDIGMFVKLLAHKAASTGTTADGMTAAGALVGRAASFGPTAYSDEAHDADLLLARLSLRPEVDQQWLSLQRAMIARQFGEIEASFAHVTEAHNRAMREMPPELSPLWFASGDQQRDSSGALLLRRTPDGQVNDVYRPTDVIYVAYKCRYLTGAEDVVTKRHLYKIELSAALVDERGESVPNFRWGPNTVTINEGLEPDIWTPGYVIVRLPNDIKSEQDYTFQLRLRDHNDPGKRQVVQSTVIKVRTR